MKGAFTLIAGDATYIVPIAHVTYVKIKSNGESRFIEFHINGEPPIMMDKVSPEDAEKITNMLSN